MFELEGARRPAGLNEPIVDRTALTVHADLHAFAHTTFTEQRCVFLAGELAALIAIDDLGLAVQGYGLLEPAHHPFGFQAVRDAPVQDVAAVEVDKGHHVHKAVAHGQVAHVQRPHLVGPGDLQITQQVGEFVLGLIRHGGAWHAVDGLDAHRFHQASHLVATYLHPLLQEFVHQPPCSLHGSSMCSSSISRMMRRSSSCIGMGL